MKLVEPSILLRAREEKAALAAEKAAKKVAQAEAELAKKRIKMEKGRVAPGDLYKPPNVLEGTYGSWDEQGVPLTDGEGVELTKSKKKKITKDWEIQQKLHAEWQEWSKSNS